MHSLSLISHTTSCVPANHAFDTLGCNSSQCYIASNVPASSYYQQDQHHNTNTCFQICGHGETPAGISFAARPLPLWRNPVPPYRVPRDARISSIQRIRLPPTTPTIAAESIYPGWPSPSSWRTARPADTNPWSPCAPSNAERAFSRSQCCPPQLYLPWHTIFAMNTLALRPPPFHLAKAVEHTHTHTRQR